MNRAKNPGKPANSPTPPDYDFIGMILPNGIQSKNPREVIFTACLSINKHSKNFITEDEEGNARADVAQKYNDFYQRLRELRHLSDTNNSQNLSLIVDGAPGKPIELTSKYEGLPFRYFNNRQKDRDTTYYDNIKNTLWDLIFPDTITGDGANFFGTVKKVNPASRASKVDIKKIVDLVKQEDLELLHNYVLSGQKYSESIQNNYNIKKGLELDKQFKAIYEYGKTNEAAAFAKKAHFIEYYHGHAGIQRKNAFAQTASTPKSYSALLNEFSEPATAASAQYQTATAHAAQTLVNIHASAMNFYIQPQCPEIDIDEIIHNFNAICNEPVLMRLMGLAMDFKVTFPESFDMENPEVNFAIRKQSDKHIKYLDTPITRIKRELPKKRVKYAYIVTPGKNSLFKDSILKNDYSSMSLSDKVAKVRQLHDYAKRLANNEQPNGSENLEALTRGILFSNSSIAEIIEPVDIVDANATAFLEASGLSEGHFTRGYRVAVQNGQSLHSLTSRSLKFQQKEQREPLYYNGNFESCIHFDAPLAYIEDGVVKAATSDVLFEYSGEMLKLKSAFSRAVRVDPAEKLAMQNRNFHDDGVEKSQKRFEKAVSFHHFPELEIPDNDDAQHQFLYGIPDVFTPDDAPRLRFGQDYTFFVYQEYLNGCGLPLKSTGEKSSQLSVWDLISGHDDIYKVNPIEFVPQENKKAVSLFHRKQVHEDASQPIAERASLEHLIARSDTGSDYFSEIDERHVLPSKIDIEPAFWYGLLSEPHMNPESSFDIKRRSNCHFVDETDYNKSKKCDEGCQSYCGGTQMDNFYPEKHIRPRYLTDPTIDGFVLQLFWDKACTLPVPDGLSEIAYYGGERGISPKSVLLRVNGSSGSSYIDTSNLFNVMEVSLKKGMTAYAKLVNNLFGDRQHDPKWDAKRHLCNGWWTHFAGLRHKAENNIAQKYIAYKKAIDAGETPQDEHSEMLQKFLDKRNIPKQIEFTHAVKEPLFVPELKNLASTPRDQKQLEHLDEWLKKDAYSIYEIGKNIIAERTAKTAVIPIGSPYGKIGVTAYFERLDAIGKIEFLRDVTPTGGLELWMRKEEFIDDPAQHVLAEKKASNHIPDRPVIPFSSESKFNLEHKIDFTNEIMSQLKSLKHVQDIEQIDDAFRSIITSLVLEYDLKTTKFEEREYYLKNLSKFKGFFTDEPSSVPSVRSASDAEQFALPKLNDVIDDADLRFKVMVLNNQKPLKPEVAYVVTTIQEDRQQPERHKTVSTQKGNLLTVYLKRGRLSSGKDERVGIIVDADSLYNKIYKDKGLISQAGKDVVSDRFSNRSQFLQYHDIIIPDGNPYDAGYDNELGIYHFLPEFDVEKQLWKFEVELDVKTKDAEGNQKQLHNPFINLSMVHYQPFSLNYNDKTGDGNLLDIQNDCRISNPDNTAWSYLLPQRKLSVLFEKPNSWFNTLGLVNLTLYYDYESLHHFQIKDGVWIVRSNFIATVQGSDDGLQWHNVASWTDEKKPKTHHALLTPDLLEKQENQARLTLNYKHDGNAYDNFRLRLVEVEWFVPNAWEEICENKTLLSDDIVNDEELRIRYVELIY